MSHSAPDDDLGALGKITIYLIQSSYIRKEKTREGKLFAKGHTAGL